LLSLKIFLILLVKVLVCLIDLIFLENNMTPHGLCAFKKLFSLLVNLRDFIPTY